MTNSARLQLGFSPLSKTIVLAKMRDVDGGRLRVGNDRGRDWSWQKAVKLCGIWMMVPAWC